MDQLLGILMILLRFIHIVGGVVWAGGAIFLVSVLAPTVQDAGQEGGRFMQRLAASGRMNNVIGMAALLTGLSGLIMYVVLYAQQGAAWGQSTYGIVLTIGAVAGLAAWGHGLFATRRASERMSVLAKEMLARNGPPAPEQIQQAQALGARLNRLAKQSAIILLVSLFGMSTAQYWPALLGGG